MIEENEKVTMEVKMEVKPAQALALMAMFDYWNILSSMGGSRHVSFFVDGDGDFHPNVQYFIERVDELPMLTDELRKLAVIEDDYGNRLYDYDNIAWKLYNKRLEKKDV